MSLKVGDVVERNTHEQGYRGKQGRIVEIDLSQQRARVQWTTNRTWYKLSKLKLAP